MLSKEQFSNYPGIYKMFNAVGEIIYIGKAKNLKKRLANYFNKFSLDIKTSVLMSQVQKIETMVCRNENEALILENELIKRLQPKYNINLKDDKSYPYLKISKKESFPKIEIVRKKINDNSLYFGPLPMVGSTKKLLKSLQFLFSLRTCKQNIDLKNRQKKCINLDINKCLGPCVNKKIQNEYNKTVKRLILFLSGKNKKLLNELKREMKTYAQKLQFEKALLIKEKIERLEKICDPQNITYTLNYEPEKKQKSPEIMLKELQIILNLPLLPVNIIGFDISHFWATDIVGAAVQYTMGIPNKSKYRRFNIRSFKNKSNDVLALYEVVKRRMTMMLKQEEEWPELLLIDGGKPQLNFAVKALIDLELWPKINACALAKKNEEIFLYKKARPLLLKKDSSSFLLLQDIRNEVHRFVLDFQKSKRKNTL